jgi:hypothetical protein
MQEEYSRVVRKGLSTVMLRLVRKSGFAQSVSLVDSCVTGFCNTGQFYWLRAKPIRHFNPWRSRSSKKPAVLVTEFASAAPFPVKGANTGIDSGAF